MFSCDKHRSTTLTHAARLQWKYHYYILSIRKSRPNKIIESAQGCSTSKLLSQNLNPRNLRQDSNLLTKLKSRAHRNSTKHSWPFIKIPNPKYYLLKDQFLASITNYWIKYFYEISFSSNYDIWDISRAIHENLGSLLNASFCIKASWIFILAII